MTWYLNTSVSYIYYIIHSRGVGQGFSISYSWYSWSYMTKNILLVVIIPDHVVLSSSCLRNNMQKKIRQPCLLTIYYDSIIICAISQRKVSGKGKVIRLKINLTPSILINTKLILKLINVVHLYVLNKQLHCGLP